MIKHGDSNSREYNSWRGMTARCYRSSHPQFKDYGGRGIKVCDRWRGNYAAFLQDMGRCPEGLTLDRINNDGDYQPDNCRWTTRTVQVNNRRPFNKLGVCKSGRHPMTPENTYTNPITGYRRCVTCTREWMMTNRKGKR